MVVDLLGFLYPTTSELILLILIRETFNIFTYCTMALIDLEEDLPDAEVDYHESSDDDFNPTAAAAEETEDSSEEEDATTATKSKGKGKGKRKAPVDEDLDSGDEVTIEAARKRKAKKRKGAEAGDDDLLLSDEGGEGGLIKTRAQRMVEYVVVLQCKHLC